MSHRGGRRAYRKDLHANRYPEQDDDCEPWAPCLSQIKLCLLVPLPLDPEGLWGSPFHLKSPDKHSH